MMPFTNSSAPSKVCWLAAQHTFIHRASTNANLLISSKQDQQQRRLAKETQPQILKMDIQVMLYTCWLVATASLIWRVDS